MPSACEWAGSALRVAYWCSASVTGVLAIAALATASRDSTTAGLMNEACQGSTGPLAWVIVSWLIIRFVLGLLQLCIHMCALCPARLFPSFAERMLGTWFGEGNPTRGLERYYGSLPRCNFAIGVVVILSACVCEMMRSCLRSIRYPGAPAANADLQSSLETVLWLELSSASILLAVLLARAVAHCNGRTREWFKLAWTPPPQSAVDPLNMPRRQSRGPDDAHIQVSSPSTAPALESTP